jgi:hypothetical protein
MFLGCGIMVVGPRRSDGRPRAKQYCGVGMMFRKPKWISRQKILNATSDNQPCTDKVLPSYTDASGKDRFDGLPELFASFDPHEWNPDELLKRFRERRSRERRSNAPSPESAVEEKFHEGSESANKE